MSYIPPAGNAVDFDFIGLAYTPPTGNAVDFAFQIPVIVSISGVAATAQAGMFTANAKSSIIGVQGTASAGLQAISKSIALSGVSGTGLAGIPPAQMNLPIAGATATAGVGSVTAVVLQFADPSGVAATAGVGTLSEELDKSFILTSVAGTADLGSLSTINIVTLPNVSSAAHAREVTLALGTESLAVTALGAAGGFTLDRFEIISGVATSSAVGGFGITGHSTFKNVTYIAWNVTANGEIGELSTHHISNVYPTLTTVAGIGGVGDLITLSELNPTCVIAAVAGTGEAGEVTPAYAIAGVQGRGRAGLLGKPPGAQPMAMVLV